MKITPLNGRVFVKRLDADKVTAGGIVIPDAAGERPDQGEVVAVAEHKSDGTTAHSTRVNVGDKILFGKFANQTVKVDGVELLVIREEEILGVITE
jgi:chaperonin GroES